MYLNDSTSVSAETLSKKVHTKNRNSHFDGCFMEEANYDEKISMMYLAISNLFLVFLGVGLVIPVIPQLKEEMHFSGTTMGMMISIFAIAQLITSPIACPFG